MYTVLYVDDLIEANYAYMNALKEYYKVIIAETPEEALPLLQSFKPPSCVVLDLDMPEPEIIKEPLRTCWQRLGEPENSYGLVIAAWIKKYTENIKVIILSSVPSRFDEYREELGDLVVLDRLTHKPSDLLEVLEKVIDGNN